MRRWICTGTAVYALSMPGVGIASEPLFLAANDPPPEFGDLLATQRSLVDIYFGNRYLTSQLASFSPGIIEFSNPADITRLIGDLSDPVLITEALSGEIGTNPDQLCPTENSRDCGVLAPPIAGVIFDEGRFRVDVFVNRRFMLTRAAEVRNYLPPSDAGFALMQNLSGAVSGSSASGSENSFSFSGLTMMAWQENSLYGSWNYSDSGTGDSRSRNFTVSQLYGQRGL